MTPILRSSSWFQALAVAGTCATLLASLSAPSFGAQTAGSTDAHAAQKSIVANLLEELVRTRMPLQAAISPDGRLVASVAPVANTGDRVNLRLLNGTEASTQVTAVPSSITQAEHLCS